MYTTGEDDDESILHIPEDDEEFKDKLAGLIVVCVVLGLVLAVVTGIYFLVR